MGVTIVTSPEAGAQLAARLIVDLVRSKPHAVLGLATGSTPLPTYAALADAVRAGAVSFGAVRGFALDEYVGIDPAHPESYHQVIRREVVQPLGMDPALVRVPDGVGADPAQACRDYDDAIRAVGGVDIQILGIGTNGHLGFNEPTTSLASPTHVTALTAQTRADNARFFDTPEQVPTRAVTQGLGTISQARTLLLLANGENKASAIAAAIEGPVSSMCPASLIQLHPDVHVIIDGAAASRLTLSHYDRL